MSDDRPQFWAPDEWEDWEDDQIRKARPLLLILLGLSSLVSMWSGYLIYSFIRAWIG